VTTIYVETPFVLQLALSQEYAGECSTLLNLASSKAVDLVVPLVALIEPFGTLRLRRGKRIEITRSWQEAARDLERTDNITYQDAAKNLQQVMLTTAEMGSNELKNLHRIVDRIWSSARILHPTVEQFKESYNIELAGPSADSKGATSIDALVLSSILGDARTLDASIDRAFLALDRKAITAPVADQLKKAGIKKFGEVSPLLQWMSSIGIT
jgi:hypothetical protein